MKTLIIKNLQLQFDSFQEDDLMAAQDILNTINGVLQERLKDSCPQILTSSIDRGDIEDSGSPDDEEDETLTVRDVAALHPEMYNFNYKWRNTENPETEKLLDEVLRDYGYKLKGLSLDEVDELICEYNDLKGYLECEVERI